MLVAMTSGTCTPMTQAFFWNSPSTWMTMPSICYAASCHWLQTMRDKELMAPCFAYIDSAFYPQINPSTLT